MVNYIFYAIIFSLIELSCTNLPNNSYPYYVNGSSQWSELDKTKNISVQPIVNTYLLSNKSVTVNDIVKPRKYFCGTSDEMVSSSLPYVASNSNSSRVKRYVLQGNKWEKLELTWAVVTNSRRSSVEDLSESEFSKALEVWSKASNLIFKRVNRFSTNIDIKVQFHTQNHGDGYPFDGNGGTLAHAFYPGSGLGGDVHFDDAEIFMRHGEVSENGVSFFITAAHEIGHSLGLRHSNEGKSLMAPFYNEFGEDFKLPYDDKLAIQSLYGNPEYDKPYSPPTPPTTTTSTTTTTTRKTTRRPIVFPSTYPTSRTFPPPLTTRKKFTTRKYTTRSYTTRRYTTPTPWVPFHYECKSNLCDGQFDAVTILGSEIMLFKEECVWRIFRHSYSKFELKQYRIDIMFPEIKRHGITRIDAAYTLERDEGIVMFINKTIIEVKTSENEAIKRNLQEINITTANRIDAAWRWGHNGHVYLLSGDQYWRLGADGNVQEDYPRNSAVWRGLPSNVSAAVTYKKQNIFLFRKSFLGI
ncbi:Matrix metalloproteinase-16 [Armadillidium nasatum]|uniref:Matrix metalloproteinase-16 n=1 Tax=Armadillidium nasatum TaxID=96803 RepID=A0A5N5SNV1_9CRUS|nr:Matrix metalloproteinase-16 [Armadillidium nasatum]